MFYGAAKKGSSSERITNISTVLENSEGIENNLRIPKYFRHKSILNL
jgi:hypothetical protein